MAGKVGGTMASRVPGTFLLHPVSVGAVALLVINDRILKARWPGWTTGKLSDAAGMVVLPLILVALSELLQRREVSGAFRIRLAAGVTAVGFVAVKFVDEIGEAYGTTLGELRWLILAPVRWLGGGSIDVPVAVEVTHDPTDVIVVPLVLLAVWVVGRYRRPTPSGG